jgi:NitT/TauT family transport system ATP-binding protein
MENSLLRLDNISLVYHTLKEETDAVDNFNLSVGEGEFIALVGPSGCGKTTILSLISGIISPTSGGLYLSGAAISGPRSDIGYMLQKDQLFEWRTIWQNLILGLEIQNKKTPENLKYTENLLVKYGLKDFKNYYPKQLSGGMRQRVALIRTLALNPKILLLDEPFSALDYQTRLKVCDDVYGIIKNENKTALLVTHDISEAISMADKIAILTPRPAAVCRMHETNLSAIKTPLLRRESPSFAGQFEQIWKELNVNEICG